VHRGFIEAPSEYDIPHSNSYKKASRCTHKDSFAIIAGDVIVTNCSTISPFMHGTAIWNSRAQSIKYRMGRDEDRQRRGSTTYQGSVPEEADAGRTLEEITGRVLGQEALGDDVIYHSSSLVGLSLDLKAIANTTYIHACRTSVRSTRISKAFMICYVVIRFPRISVVFQTTSSCPSLHCVL
jgi:hypothetical protein